MIRPGSFRPPRVPSSWLWLGTSGCLALLLTACGANPQTVFNDQSNTTHELLGLFKELIVMAAFVFIVVEGALVFIVFRYRRKPDQGLPPQIHGNVKLEAMWTAIPVVLLMIVLVPTIQTIFATQAPAPQGALPVKVIGHQFWWEFQYPTLGVVTADEMHTPVGQYVNAELSSVDVIHNFWVPAIAGQRNANPNDTNYIWWKADKTGEFPGQCVELCGYSHANMRLKLFVDSQQAFNTWVADQKKPAATPTDPTAVKGEQVFMSRGCSGCHTINGTQANGKVGPNLTHFASRTSLAGASLENTPANVKMWVHDPPAVKPGSKMPNLNLNETDLNNVVAYLETLK